MAPLVKRMAGAVYRGLVALLPRGIRVDFGPDMVRDFGDSLDASRSTGDTMGRALRGSWDLLCRLPVEWLAVARTSRAPNHPSRPRRGRRVESLLRDVRFSARSLVRSWRVSGIIVATLALGLGANAAVLSVVNAVLIRPLPHPEPERLMTLGEVSPGVDIAPRWTSPPNYVDWREQARSFEFMALFRGRSMSLTGGDEPQYVYGAWATHDFFRTFGVSPLLGRDLDEASTRPGSPPVVVMSHALWVARFDRSPDVIGQVVQVDGVPRTVVAVMPEDFTAPSSWIGPDVQVLLWLPFPLDPTAPSWGRDNRSYHVVGRLRPDADLVSARREMTALGARLAAEYPEANDAWSPVVVPWREAIVGSVRAPLFLAGIAALVVLLIACANVANLLLNRMLGRRHEVSVRRALGASRRRLAALLLTESLIVSVAGSVAGLLVAQLLLALFRAVDPGTLPLTDGAGLDLVQGMGTLGLGLLLGVLFGVIPALAGSRSSVGSVARSSARGHAHRHGRLRQVLATSQLVLAFVLLVSAALVGRSFRSVVNVPLGFEPEGLVTATVVLSWDRLTTLEERSDYVERSLTEVRRVPGVESVAMINSLPLSGSNAWRPFMVDGVVLTDPDRPPAAAFRGVSPGYFRTMQIPILAGREFTEADLTDPRVAVVNEAMLSYHWPDGDPLGRVITVPGSGEEMTVVGVVGDVRHRGIQTPSDPEIYQPYSVETLSSKTFVVRSDLDPTSLAGTLRRVLVEVDPDQPVRDIRPMTEYVATAVGTPRFNAGMFGLSGALALLLALVGLFGVVSHAVAERTREFGIRIAMGARSGSILRLALSSGVGMVVVGAACGVVLAVLCSRLLEGLLFGVQPLDVATYAGVSVVFAAVTLLACILPARRALRVDPVSTLRRE